MAFDTTYGTKLASLVDPEVLADMVDKKLTNYIKFSPLSTVDTTLVGRPGDTITVPTWKYIGDAVSVGEGEAITIKKLEAEKDTATIKKVGIGVELTDEAVLSGYGDPVGQAVEQIALSIASAVDNDMLAVLETIDSDMTSGYTEASIADSVNDALVLFGEDVEGEKVLLVSPAAYKILRKSSGWLPASEISADIIIKGAVGEIYGCQVVVTNKLTGKAEAFIVKPGALATYLKRDTLVESDRDIYQKFTGITADKHFVNYLYDASKAVRLYTASEAAG